MNYQRMNDMKTKFADYKNKMGPVLKSLTDDKGRVATDAAAALKHTLDFQNLLVEGVSAKFSGVVSDVNSLKTSLNNVESRLSPLETTVRKLTEEALPEVRTQVRALSAEVRDVTEGVNTALTTADSAKALAESVRQELEIHVSSDETANKLKIITKALDDVGQELKKLAQDVASIPSVIPMDLGAVEEMIKNELKKLGFLPAGPAEAKAEATPQEQKPVAVPKPVKETTSFEQAKFDTAVLNLEDDLKLAFVEAGLPKPPLNSEADMETRLQSIEKGMSMLMADCLELSWDYVPKPTFEERVEDLKQGMTLVKEAVELAK